MSLIVPCSIVILVHRWGIYLTVYTHNWSDQFNYIAYNEPEQADRQTDPNPFEWLVYIPNDDNFDLLLISSIGTMSEEAINIELSMCSGPSKFFKLEEYTEQKMVLFIPEMNS